MVSENKTVAATCGNFAFGKSANSVDHFLIHSDWPERELNKRPIELLYRCSELDLQPAVVCCIDDTFNHRTGTNTENVEKHFDHAEGRYVLVRKIVICHYKDRKVGYPSNRLPSLLSVQWKERQGETATRTLGCRTAVGTVWWPPASDREDKIRLLLIYQLRENRFKSKIELACELVDSAEALGIKAKTYVFDCWFLCKLLTYYIQSYGKGWIGVLKSNRILLFKGQRVSLSQFIASVPKQALERSILKREGAIGHSPSR